MTAEATVNQIIDQALSAAQQAQEAAQTAADQAINYAGSITIGSAPPEIDTPELFVVNPPTYDPDAIAKVGPLRTDAQNLIQAKFDEFLDKYHPDYIAELATLTDWIENAIKNGGTGLAPAVEQAIWDRAREREGKLDDRMAFDAADGPAAIGWEIPQGATAMRHLMATQEAVNRDSTLSRDIMVQMAMMEYENIKFAISAGVNLKTALLSSAQAFANAMLLTYRTGVAEAALLVQATTSFYSQSLAYHQMINQQQGLLLRHDLSEVDRSLRNTALAIETVDRRAARQVAAASDAARVYGDIAASARSTTNTMASIVNETVNEA